MSFNFTWPEFSPDFYEDARVMLDQALNRGPKPKVIADDIKVEEVSMGTVPPDLEILEIGDLSRDRFRGIFRLTYAGDAHLVLSTKVQANPLSKPTPTSSAVNGRGATSGHEDDTFTPFSSAGSSSRGILFAAAPLIVPMHLRLSHVRLRAIIVLVVSKTKGITLVFKNDPLESVQVSSTFDSVAVIAKYLQQEIEGQLKEVFREDLPGIIHRLSQKWLSGQPKRKEKGHDTGQGSTQQPPQAGPRSVQEEVGQLSSSPIKSDPKPSKRKSQNGRRSSSAAEGAPLTPSSSSKKKSGRAPSSKAARPPLPSSQSASAMAIPNQQIARSPAEQDEDEDEASPEIPPPLSSSFDDAESYDPTYGLRPDEVRLPKDGKGFKGLKGLKKGGGALGGRKSVGLGGLLTEVQPVHQEELENTDESGSGAHAIDEADLESLYGGQSEWAEEDGLNDVEDQDGLRVYCEQNDIAPQRSNDDLFKRRDREERVVTDDVPDVPSESDADSVSSLSSSEDENEHDNGDKSPSLPTRGATRSNLDQALDIFNEDDPLEVPNGLSLPSPSRSTTAASTTGSDRRQQIDDVSCIPSSKGNTRRYANPLTDALRVGNSSSNESTHSLGSYRAGATSRKVGAGVGLSGSDVGYGFMPKSASRRAADVFSASKGLHGNQTASYASSQYSLGAKGSLSTSASMSSLPPTKSSMLSRSQSSGLQSLSSSRPPTRPIRPRIFHSSSLIRPVDPSSYGGDAGDTSLDDGNPSYPNSSWTGSVRGGRADSVGGGSTTIYGGGGGGSRSGPGSSRTFTIKRRDGGSRADTARSIGSEVGSGGGGTVIEEGGQSWRPPPRQTMTRSSSTLSNLVGQRGWDWGPSARATNPGEDHLAFPPYEHSGSQEDLQGALPPSSSASSLDDPGSSRSHHSHSDSFSGSRAGTLSTLEPEPMDESSAAYKRQLEREKLGGLVRVGWDGVDSTDVTRAAGSAGRRGGVTAVPLNRPTRRSSAATPQDGDIVRGGGAAGIPASTSHPRYLHLQDLVASNQTLSPYTRLSDTRGWAVRSMPGTPGATGATGVSQGSMLGHMKEGWNEAVQDADARRRRTFKLGG